ncbi:MAG: hypothetical protein H6575_13855 [Lewinellaceae bacterium]|nr:hypothetical protein [Lewinellaceae bacterium]
MKHFAILIALLLAILSGCKKNAEFIQHDDPVNMATAQLNGETWTGAATAEWQRFQDVLVVQGWKSLCNDNPCGETEDITIAIHHFQGAAGVYDISTPSYGLFRSTFAYDMLLFCGKTETAPLNGQMELTTFDPDAGMLECRFSFDAQDAQGNIYQVRDGVLRSNRLKILDQ